jgi:acetyl/propionyl-CoA carboxylase alpha subunit
MIGSVLVANRGEIAVRLIRTYRALGLRTVAVYSDTDALALHVRLADEARRLGPAPVTASYLNQDAILAAARDAGADAVDPGYGLLSEDPGFAGAVAAAGLVFVGPPAAAIAAMGDKLAARSIARRAGLPVVPGSGAIGHPEQGLSEAARLGYPLLVKAAGGGGGRGLRVAGEASELPGALAAAGQRPAQHRALPARRAGPARVRQRHPLDGHAGGKLAAAAGPQAAGGGAGTAGRRPPGSRAHRRDPHEPRPVPRLDLRPAAPGPRRGP